MKFISDSLNNLYNCSNYIQCQKYTKYVVTVRVFSSNIDETQNLRAIEIKNVLCLYPNLILKLGITGKCRLPFIQKAFFVDFICQIFLVN